MLGSLVNNKYDLSMLEPILEKVSFDTKTSNYNRIIYANSSTIAKLSTEIKLNKKYKNKFKYLHMEINEDIPLHYIDVK